MMMLRNLLSDKRFWVVGAVVTAGAWLPSCGRDAHLVGRKVRDMSAEPVTAYGKRLDSDASPKDVVWVFLQAVVDDYAAPNREARDKAFDVQLGVCAPEYIKTKTVLIEQPSPQQENEQLFRVVQAWAPVVGHYRQDFRADYETLTSRMFVAQHAKREGQPEEADVYLNISDPGGDAAASVVARFRLVKEADLWRIWWIGWETSTRDWRKRPPSGVALRPATRPADKPASQAAASAPGRQ